MLGAVGPLDPTELAQEEGPINDFKLQLETLSGLIWSTLSSLVLVWSGLYQSVSRAHVLFFPVVHVVHAGPSFLSGEPISAWLDLCYCNLDEAESRCEKHISEGERVGQRVCVIPIPMKL